MDNKSKQHRNTLNVLFSALVASGYAETILNAPLQDANAYPLGEDTKTDMRLVPGFLRTLYTSVCAGKLYDSAIEVPAFDLGADGEPVPVTTAAPESLLSYEERQRYASAGYRMALSYGRHDDGRWLLGMTKRHVVKDEEGRDQVVLSTDVIVVPLSVWLAQEIERTNPETSPEWYSFMLLARQQGVSVPLWEDGVDAAKATFTEWLNMVPWTRDNDTRTHLEKAVQRSADSKWKAFKVALIANNDRDVKRILDAWNLMVYSPKMAEDIKAIRSSAEFQLYMADQAIEQQEAQLEKLEKALYIQNLKDGIAARQKALDERMAKLLGEQKPEQPTDTKDNVKPAATVLAMPNVINSR